MEDSNIQMTSGIHDPNDFEGSSQFSREIPISPDILIPKIENEIVAGTV